VAVWMTPKEASQLTGIAENAILDLVKTLQVGFTRDRDGIMLVDAEALEAHVPAQASTAKHPLCAGEDHSTEPPPRRDPTLLSKEAARRLRRELRRFLGAHQGVTMTALSRAGGVHDGEVAELLRYGRRNTCRSTTAAKLRKAMREWPAEESATEPELDIATVRQHWNEMPAELKRMGRTAVGALITDAWPEALDRDVLSLVFSPKFFFHYSQVSGPYRDVVQKALERLYGRPLTVRCRIADPEQDIDMTMREWTSDEQLPSPPIAPADEPAPNEEDFDLTMAEAAKFLGLTYYHARKYIPKVDCTALRKKYINLGPSYRLAVSLRWLTENKSKVLSLKQADDEQGAKAKADQDERRERIAELMGEPQGTPACVVEITDPTPTRPGFIRRLLSSLWPLRAR